MENGYERFYVTEVAENEIIISDKGRLETKFILEVDEQKALLYIRIKTLQNLYVLIPFYILGLLFFQFIDWKA